MRPSVHERGYSMAWWAVVLAFVVLPLAALTVDVTRLLQARTRAQTAADAVCTAYARSLDPDLFRTTSQAEALGDGVALPPNTSVGVSISGDGFPEIEVTCFGQTTVTPIIGGFGPYVARAAATAKGRWNTSPWP